MENKKISKQYNGISEEFSNTHRYENRVNIKSFHEELEYNFKNKKVLDLGCGDGSDLQILKNKGAKIFGLDSSKEMVKLAKKKLNSNNIKTGLFEKIPFEEKYFDFVISKYAMQTSRKIEPIYKETAKVLKSKGYFIFLVVHPFRQFIEKKKIRKNYFKQEIVKSIIFRSKLLVKEPTHTLNEYLSPYFLKHFEIISFIEKYDPAAEKINGDKYPGFMIIKARKK